LKAVIAIDGVIHPRTGADGHGLQLIFSGSGREDLDNGQAALEEGREGVLQGDGDRLVILGGHRVDEGEEGTIGVIGHVGFEGLHDISGGDIRAIRELCTLAQAYFVNGV
jgi:hypothetical protein